MLSADEPNRLRGPQHHWAVCDEIAAWDRPEAFDMLLLGLRLGENPRCAIATTPRPVLLIKRLLADESVAVVRGSTYEKRDNLAPAFFAGIVSRYQGTRIGRQEIDGEVLDDPVIAEIGRKYNKSPAQVIIRWHLQEGLVVIPKSTHAERIQDNLDVFHFELDEVDMGRIAELDRPDGKQLPDPETNNDLY